MTLLRGAADLISERSNELAALMSMEVGKNRLEALGDVEESADLIRYYCIQLESHDGFSFAMDTIAEHETTRSVLRPYGVWESSARSTSRWPWRPVPQVAPRGWEHRGPQAEPTGLVLRSQALRVLA